MKLVRKCVVFVLLICLCIVLLPFVLLYSASEWVLECCEPFARDLEFIAYDE